MHALLSYYYVIITRVDKLQVPAVALYYNIIIIVTAVNRKYFYFDVCLL